MFPADVTWDGSNYLLIGRSDRWTVAAKLSPSGELSELVQLAEDTAAVSIATNGTTTIAGWINPEPCPILCIGTYGHATVVRLGSDLQRLDAATLVETPVIDALPLLWDGSRFLAAWRGEGAQIEVVKVPVGGGAQQPVATISAQYGSSFSAAAITGGIALAWSESRPAGLLNRAATIEHDNRVRTATLDLVRQETRPHVVAVPGFGILYVDAQPQFEAPHHGSIRLLARISPSHPLAAPEPPRGLDAESKNGRIHLSWSEPEGDADIDGYRVEYRVSDGAWHELEQWLDQDELSVTLPWTVAPGVPVLFRVRTFGEGGTSPYSVLAGVNATKRRRSVR